MPEWARQNKYDIEAKSDTPGEPSLQQFFGEVSKFVVEPYGLKYHIEKRVMTAYSLGVAKGGIKMKPSPASFGDIPGFGLPPGRLNINHATMKEFCGLLQIRRAGSSGGSQTGLGGTRYGGSLRYQMDDEQATKMGLKKAPPPPRPHAAPCESRPGSSQSCDDVQVWAKYMKLLNRTSTSDAETYGRRQHESFDLKRTAFAGVATAYRLDHT